jgi:hypothetical protein
MSTATSLQACIVLNVTGCTNLLHVELGIGLVQAQHQLRQLQLPFQQAADKQSTARLHLSTQTAVDKSTAENASALSSGPHSWCWCCRGCSGAAYCLGYPGGMGNTSRGMAVITGGYMNLSSYDLQTVQDRTVQGSTVQGGAAQGSTIQGSTRQGNTRQCRAVQGVIQDYQSSLQL